MDFPRWSNSEVAETSLGIQGITIGHAYPSYTICLESGELCSGL